MNSYIARPLAIRNYHQPICQKCQKPITILEPGVIVHGNINIVDVTKSSADGGGIIGRNFPKDNDLLVTGSSVPENVGKMAYHLPCLVACLTTAVKEYAPLADLTS